MIKRKWLKIYTPYINPGIDELAFDERTLIRSRNIHKIQQSRDRDLIKAISRSNNSCIFIEYDDIVIGQALEFFVSSVVLHHPFAMYDECSDFKSKFSSVRVTVYIDSHSPSYSPKKIRVITYITRKGIKNQYSQPLYFGCSSYVSLAQATGAERYLNWIARDKSNKKFSEFHDADIEDAFRYIEDHESPPVGYKGIAASGRTSSKAISIDDWLKVNRGSVVYKQELINSLESCIKGGECSCNQVDIDIDFI